MSEEEIINRLFGDIQPLYETYEDDKRFDNLNNYGKILDFIIDELVECAKYKNDNSYSANRIGEKAFNLLKIQVEYLQDILDELEE